MEKKGQESQSQDIKQEANEFLQDLSYLIQYRIPIYRKPFADFYPDEGQSNILCPGPQTVVCADPCHLQDAESDSSDDDNNAQQPKPFKVKPEGHIKCTRRTPLLDEVLQDQEFVTELYNGNKLVLEYMLQDNRFFKLLDYLVIEPKFMDNPERCFQLPFISCEALCLNRPEIEQSLFTYTQNGELICRNDAWTKIFSYFKHPNPLDPINRQKRVPFLGSTASGYVSKVITFWMIQQPVALLKFILECKEIIANMFDHLYLCDSVTDLLVQMCTVERIDKNRLNVGVYNEKIRIRIIENCINCLESYHENSFMTQQVFSTLTGIVKGCFCMCEPQSLFDYLLSPFVFLSINKAVCLGGDHTKFGCAFLNVLLSNVFTQKPVQAQVNVIEHSFGLQTGLYLRSEDGLVPPSKLGAGPDKIPEMIKKNTYKTIEEEKKLGAPKTEGEASILGEIALIKHNFMKQKQPIYRVKANQKLQGFLIVTLIPQLKQLLFSTENYSNSISVQCRLNIYQLLATIIKLGYPQVCNTIIEQGQFIDGILRDYEKFSNSSLILATLNELILQMVMSENLDLLKYLFVDQKLLTKLQQKLEENNCKANLGIRKDIYAYIFDLIEKVKCYVEDSKSNGNIQNVLNNCKSEWDSVIQHSTANLQLGKSVHFNNGDKK